MLRLDFNLVWNIVNVIVLYLLLKHFLIKPVMDIMNKRQAMVDQSITNARASESQASELKSRYEEKLAASAEEGKKLVEEAKAEAKTVQERMIKEAGEAGGPGSGAVIRSAGIFRNTAHTQKKDRTEYAIHAKTFRQAG